MIAAAPRHRTDSMLTSGLAVRNGRSPRPELGEAWNRFQQQRRRSRVEGRYDAAGDGDMTRNIWVNADFLDADSANSQVVRQRLVSRSRYEASNNGFADGIASSWATDVVGSGPTLRMQTGSENFNRMVEREWTAWTKEIHFRRKLWTMARSVDVDGETFAIIRQNRRLRHRVKLDWSLHETDQCRSPVMPWGEPGRIDGLWFDEFGNITQYEFLQEHPGSQHRNSDYLNTELIPARFVCHWYTMNRAGQHRGIPAGTSTLNIGAASRRWREAVVEAAENIADFSLFLKTQLAPDECELFAPMSAMEIQKRMMVALPEGYDPVIPKAEQPSANHQEFHRSLIQEQARPRAMPFNKAAADHSGDSFASGRLDHIPYFESIDHVHRLNCNDLVLDVLFDVWFDFAVVAFGWLGGNPEALNGRVRTHIWDWPKHTVADEKSEAAAKDTKLKNASTFLAEVDKQSGKDYEDRLVFEAESNGLTVDQQRQWNFVINLPQALQAGAAQSLGLTAAPEPIAVMPEPESEDDETT